MNGAILWQHSLSAAVIPYSVQKPAIKLLTEVVGKSESCSLRINTYERLIPFPHQSDLTIYGKDVMDLTILGLRSI